MPSGVTAVFWGVGFLFLGLQVLLRLTQDGKEPKAIETTIPFLSPIIAMIRYKADVYTRLMDKYGLPIYTLRMPGARIYVVNSTNLIPVVQRQFRTVAFTPFAARAFKYAMGGSKTANDIMATDMTEDHGYLMSFDTAIHPAVSPGPALDAMNRASVRAVAVSLDKLRRQSPITVDMYKWIQHEVLLATTDAVYGPQNPYRNPAMEEAWYIYEPRITTFMLNLLPAITAKRSLKARELMVQNFEDYFKAGGQNQASELVRRRYEHNVQNHLAISDIARTEIGGSFALLSNTIPATFWLLWQILSDPTLFKDCRQELLEGVQESEGVCKIDVDYIKTSCPIFLSTFQEVFRFYGINNSVRMVLEDHMLVGQYLLKKGSTVMMPAPVQHSIQSVWGSDVAKFNHKRFVRAPGSKRHNPVAFRGFGGGTTLCPGRHFATCEILAFAALTVLQLEIMPVRGKWTRPSTEKTSMAGAIPTPDHDVKITVRPIGSQSWTAVLSDSDKPIPISVEDNDE
ncbi:hypothetical protein KVR01_011885 [Diaporthe batatas]|uniref:uncharacterized protein n=1 Tax=Diaporthe batatas TaxID=748121 RepID=UPI001D0427A6|nr:uncharacterized protein KVR01_011885 [Diaporthe batatas]KAG8158124.1 hypothetical protein KVR01_011885 [Diaporthe batatas]